MVLYEVKNRVGFITLNRPEKRNALSYELVSLLKNLFSKAEADSAVKIIILRAHGGVFCSGADLAALRALQTFSYEENRKDSNHLKELLLQIYTLKKVVIAEVQGHALAGGCGLAVVCDFVFAAPHAKMGYTEVKIGFVPAIVTVFLSRKSGEQNTKRLLLSGELVSGGEAVKLGLVNQVVEKEKLSTFVFSYAQQLINQNSAQAMGQTKQMIAQLQAMPLEEALSYAATLNARARSSEDCKKGIAAFLNKEKIDW